jgi:hypothetical protein
MKLARTLSAAIAVVAVAAMGVPTAQARNGVKIGVLNCNVQGGASFVFGSSRNLDCVYTPADKGRKERYVGEIDRWGIDIGYQTDGKMVWAVFAPSKDVRPGALSGGYGGISATVAAGYGISANALVGGFEDSIALQPLSVEGVKGTNIAAGIAGLGLRSVR